MVTNRLVTILVNVQNDGMCDCPTNYLNNYIKKKYKLSTTQQIEEYTLWHITEVDELINKAGIKKKKGFNSSIRNICNQEEEKKKRKRESNRDLQSWKPRKLSLISQAPSKTSCQETYVHTRGLSSTHRVSVSYTSIRQVSLKSTHSFPHWNCI